MSLLGPKPKCRDVRDLIAIGWEADPTRTSILVEIDPSATSARIFAVMHNTRRT
jgi:hypothetical protein